MDRVITTINSFLNFVKIEHTILSLPLLYAGSYLATDKMLPPLNVVLLIFLAGTGARILGIAMNRIFDKNIDAKNPRTINRELVTGELSLLFGIIVGALGFFIYLMACYFLNPLVLFLSPIPAFVLITYSLLKRFTPFCHFGIGLSLALAPLGAYLAVTGTFNLTIEILLFAIFTFFWMSGFDIIYAFLDIESDRKSRVYSMPALMGERGAQKVALLCHFISIIILLVLALKTYKGPAVFLPLLTAILSFVFGYIPVISVEKRFFPTSAIAGVAGALVIVF